ncbi:hypothetical protein MNBD_GAMMA21-1555 [hydrothermal vent metagenome]|uniref:Uncharacterized protein n=1 Tax=hydrothermal vent metagenome TaxID=652676 RepID=A0A3B0ZQR1_9ZZZZ
MNRKLTAWKKSRKFGDIYGGRTKRRLEDNIFQRAHSLKRPNPGERLPILIEENPSKHFFFPISAEEANDALKSLPKRDYTGITHIWLKRIKLSDYEDGLLPLAEFICGSGVRVIVLYPWPRTMVQNFGQKKPSQRMTNEYSKYHSIVKKVEGNWQCKWQLTHLRKFYIASLLYHEVGHHIDWYNRHWSKSNSKQLEDYADQYAIQKSSTGTYVFNRLEKSQLKKN